MKDHRIIQNGIPLDFTCENRKFKTDIAEGYQHNPAHNYKGSVTKAALYEDGNSLWIEHVIDIDAGSKCFWFLWYDANGLPLIPMSGVMDKVDLNEVIKNIAEIRINI